MKYKAKIVVEGEDGTIYVAKEWEVKPRVMELIDTSLGLAQSTGEAKLISESHRTERLDVKV